MATTIKPTGVKIERDDDLNFVCSWKVGDTDYGKGTLFWYRTIYKTEGDDKEYGTEDDPTLYGDWVEESIGLNDTDHTVSLNPSDWYPTEIKDENNNVIGYKPILRAFQICLQGIKADELDENPSEQKTYEWQYEERNGELVRVREYGSIWELYGYNNQYSRIRTTFAPSGYSYGIKYLWAPTKPVLSAALDSERNNVTKFSWTAIDDKNNNRPFTKTEYQSMIIKDISDGHSSSPWNLNWGYTSNNDWYSGYRYNASESMEIADDIRTSQWNDINSWRSWARIFRTRALGPGGPSYWNYDKHVYAKPYRPTISKVMWDNDYDSLSMSVYVEWTANANAAHPIDSVEVQYLIDTPLAGQTCPSEENWPVAATLADSTYTDAEKFTIGTRPGEDQCLWIRIVAKHDALETASRPYLVRSGSLKAPDGIDSLEIFEATCEAKIGVTNASTVPDSKIAIVFWREDSLNNSDEYVCGIIDPTSSSYTNPIMVKVFFEPGDTLWFGAYAFQGTYSSSSNAIDPIHSVTQYTVKANMKSSKTWNGGAVPPIPTLRVTSDRAGEAHVDWTWNWLQGVQAEISWSKDEYAWNSIEGPQTYIVDNMHWSDIRIPNLEIGVEWYFRVRLGKETNGNIVYGPYSNTVSIKMSTAPEKPSLSTSTSTAMWGGKFNLFWTYENEDGMPQDNAEIYFCRINSDDSVTNIRRAARASKEKSVTISTPNGASDIVNNDSFYLRMFVQSSSGLKSEYSDPIKIDAAYEPRCIFRVISMSRPLSEEAILSDTYRLNSMPLTVTVEGFMEGTMSLIIKRAEAYNLDRPDESVFNGFEDETIVSVSQTNSTRSSGPSEDYGYGEYDFTITNDMLIGSLDDGARYTLLAIAQDKYGQVATASEEFIVEWTHQAIIPQATAYVDGFSAFITPVAPTGTGVGDTVDIYRLSSDKPQLIVKNGSFGTTYVDPYPASGIFGGHRVVYKTVNGDYITSDNRHAWIDLGFDDGDYLRFIDTIIDFGNERVSLLYNMDLDNSWKKDFEETKYLGGSVQGDWNPAVSRTGSVNGVVVSTTDNYLVQQMRRLATYPGICHIRTPEGSSFAANVEVSESRDLAQGMGLVNFTLNFTRVDPDGLEGLTYEDWIARGE